MNPEEEKLGIKGSSTRQIFFNDVEIPVENMLGERETDIYGSETLEDINAKIKNVATENNTTVSFFQSNTTERQETTQM